MEIDWLAIVVLVVVVGFFSYMILAPVPTETEKLMDSCRIGCIDTFATKDYACFLSCVEKISCEAVIREVG